MSFNFPEINNANDGAKVMGSILRSLADGYITPNEASSVAGVIETYRKTLETSEFEGRLSALESKI